MTISLDLINGRYYAPPDGALPSSHLASFSVETRHVGDPGVLAHVINRAFQEVYARGLDPTDVRVSVVA